ncbi:MULTISPECIES: hypothetical protein [unclassified Undibacterium]|uniref:hypothetical protein n=1 Tax=unclassified Undibacterium TaxID=2630295 RepID=UPI002AC8D117|nr:MULTISPECIES: hypothetical protein [unclassified Undibacterium]MEB0137645.1 hypothetical protein [Undibacterium sp. CCC2.1]MEB0170646.1 hypothetical protein [Undibacterium sp. CCC1.1]MEB0174587.1 hypothetical protein [Undibacterium sp. CCC3.4]MEB0213615.1 hypothetical protein [Undibacterium sp. 5I2]WPX43783.1 hypothetical protein RHM61_00670 [Undibacterium sp. CCC3.4]
MKTFKNKIALVAASVIAMSAGVANAAVDLTPVTSAFTAADVVTGVMAVAAVLAVIYVSIKAAKIVLGMLRGG